MKRLFAIFAAIFVFILPVKSQELAKQPYKEFKPFKMVFLPDVHLSFSNMSQQGWFSDLERTKLKEENGISENRKINSHQIYYNKEKILFNESHVILQDVIKSLNQEKKPDFVVFGGNLTQNEDGNFSDLPMFLDTVADLNADYYAILGDREASSKEDFTREFDFKIKEQTFWSVEPLKDVLLIGLDTSIKGDEAGYLNLHQLFWLDNVLKNNAEKFTIIAMHHPPIATCEKDKTVWKKYVLKKPDLFLDLINLYPQVKIVLSGHHFSNFTKKVNEKLFITCPSIVVYPNEYKTFTVYPDRVEVDSEKISFKQIIKKAEKSLVKSDYAREYNLEKPKTVLNYQKGDKYSNKQEYFLGKNEQKNFFHRVFISFFD